MRARLTAGAALLLLPALLAVGCAGETTTPPPGPATPSGTGELIREEPSVTAFTIDDQPLWGSEQLPIKFVTDVRFLGQTAIVSGTQGWNSDAAIAAVDARTGTASWVLRLLDKLPGADGAVLWSGISYPAGTGPAGKLIVEYYSDTCTHSTGMCPPGASTAPELGIAALSVEDGSVSWTYPGVPTVGPEAADTAEVTEDMAVRLAAADDDIALMVVAPTRAVHGSQYTDPATVRTVAVDPTTGRHLWEAAGIWAQAIAGDTVLATRPAGQPGQLTDGFDVIVAVDRLTGEQRWSLADRHPRSGLLLTTPELAVVQSLDGKQLSTHLVRTADGAAVAELDPGVRSCVAGDDLIACAVSGLGFQDRLQTYRAGEPVPLTAEQTIGDLYLSTASADYIFSGRYSSRNTAPRLALDRSANVLSDPLPGRAVRVTGEYAVFDTSESPISGPGSFAVYRVTS